MNLRFLALALALFTPAVGCTAYVRGRPAVVHGYSAVYTDAPPADIGRYPHVPYEGADAYLVNGRWYYPSSNGWVVFNDEPPPLYRHRRYVLEAPPAYAPYPGRRYEAPPANTPYPDRRYEAPPASVPYPTRRYEAPSPSYSAPPPAPPPAVQVR